MPPNNNGNGATDRFPNVDLPATSDNVNSDAPLRYIDEALDNMLADDTEGIPQDDLGTPAAPAAPTYPQPVTPPQQARAPVTPPRAAPRVAPQAPQAPAAPQPQLTPQQQQEAAARERSERDPFGSQADLLEAQQDRYVEALAKQVYNISPEDMDAFLSGDSTKVSGALARVHVNAVGSVMRVISQQMPIWVSHMLQIRDVAREAEDGFWKANPGLDKAAHKDAALQIARAYRQMNPQTPTVEVYRAVGAMVASMFNVNNQQAPSAPVSPNQPRTPGRVVRRVPQAYSPAGTHPTNAPIAKIDNPWSVASEIIAADEAGFLDNVR